MRLSDVNPPNPEPKRTIYRDIVTLPDPVKLGITIHYFNYDDVALYFQITGSGTGYTFGTVNLGSLASGANAYINLDELASRAKPSAGDLPNGEMEENITLILKGYTDSGYSNLKWTFERTVTVHWINSADAAFTVDFLNNFDDGTVQGWATVGEVGATPTLSFVTDYVLSTPYSLRMDLPDQSGQTLGRIYKSFTTPNKTKVYAIFDIRVTVTPTAGYTYAKYIEIRKDSYVLVHLGKLHDNSGANYVPINKWIRVVVPLTPNSSMELQVAYDIYRQNAGERSLWLDDFKIISK